MRWRANIARVQRNRARPARPGTPRRTLRVLRLQCRAGFGIGGEAAFAAYPRFGCGCSSGVEHNLAKVGVVGSNPIARSKKSCDNKRTCWCDNLRIRQVSAERNEKILSQSGKNPGSLFVA